MTGGKRVASLVGNGLTVENGTLGLTGVSEMADRDAGASDESEGPLVDRPAATLDRQQAVIDEQAAIIADLRERNDRLRRRLEASNGGPVDHRSVLNAGGVLGLLGLGAGTASAESDPTGQVGTSERPLETLYADGLAGPLTDGQELDSLVGADLPIQDGALTAPAPSDDLGLQIRSFSIDDRDDGGTVTVETEIFQSCNEPVETLTVTFSVEESRRGVIHQETVEPGPTDFEFTTVSFPVGVEAGEFTATVTAEADNVASDTTQDSFTVGQSIENWNDLDEIRNNTSGAYLVANDLTAGTDGYEDVVANPDGGFEPIGDDSSGFSGSIRGGGCVIEDLVIERDEEYIGLFGGVDAGGTVRSLVLENADVSRTGDTAETPWVGGLAGVNKGTIEDCAVTGSVAGKCRRIGGLIGRNDGYIRRCYTDITVEYIASSGSLLNSVGGLTGSCRGDGAAIRQCFASGNVIAEEGSATVLAGGLAGSIWDAGTVTDCYSTVDVASDGFAVGGLTGQVLYSGSKVRRCYAAGTVSDGGDNVAGVVGYSDPDYNDPDDGASDSYRDVESTGRDAGIGNDQGTSDVTGLDTARMQGVAAETNMDALDFSATWATVSADDGDADAYPVLQAIDRQVQLAVRDDA